jgi:hypothetical protein
LDLLELTEEAYMKVACMLVLGAVALPAAGQTAPWRATAIVGAGKAGSWDTSIAVTNLDVVVPLEIIITTQLNRDPGCVPSPCNDVANTTIPPLGTFVLDSIPPSAAPTASNGPQAFYVLSSPLQPAPAVSAFICDTAAACDRGFAVSAAPFSVAFDWRDLSQALPEARPGTPIW